MPSERRLNIHYIIMQTGYWAVYAAHTGYQAALLQGRGFSDVAISVMLALRCLSGVVLMPVLGAFADRHPNIPLRVITAVSLIVSTVAAGLLLIPTGFFWTLILLMVIGAFELSIYPLLDSMAVQFIDAGVNVRYSIGRGAGSLAYASCSALLGMQAGRFGVESTLITHVALLLAVLLIVWSFPVCPVTKRASDAPPPRRFIPLLRANPVFAIMLVGLLFGIASNMPAVNFLVNIVRDRGGTEASLGLALFFMAGSELPMAFLFPKLLKKFGSARLLLAAMFFMAVKYIVLLVVGNLALTVAAQALQMFGYGLFTPASVFFVSDSVSEADRVQGQTIMMMATNGLGGVLGSLIAGPAIAAWGTQGMLGVCLALASTATVIAALALRQQAATKRVSSPAK